MSGLWTRLAEARIAAIHEGLPEDTEFNARRQAIAAVRPLECYQGWPAKCWQRAARSYLNQYDPRPAGPLEALMRGG